MPYDNAKDDLVSRFRAEPTYRKLLASLKELAANNSTFRQVSLYTMERTEHFLRKTHKDKDSIIGMDAFPLLEEITEYFRENAIRVDSEIYRLITSLESRLAQEAISHT